MELETLQYAPVYRPASENSMAKLRESGLLSANRHVISAALGEMNGRGLAWYTQRLDNGDGGVPR
jgi:hypothetical protein